MAVIAAAAIALAQLAPHTRARVIAVAPDRGGADGVSHRLQDLGFIAGEDVQIVARAPGGDPLAVRVGFSTFALRRSEADRVQVLPAQDE
jgi:ferrous iron transport protein A